METSDDVIACSIALLKAIHQHYGATDGQLISDNLMAALPADIGHEIVTELIKNPDHFREPYKKVTLKISDSGVFDKSRLHFIQAIRGGGDITFTDAQNHIIRLNVYGQTIVKLTRNIEATIEKIERFGVSMC